MRNAGPVWNIFRIKKAAARFMVQSPFCVAVGARCELAADAGVVDRHVDRGRAGFDVGFDSHCFYLYMG